MPNRIREITIGNYTYSIFDNVSDIESSGNLLTSGSNHVVVYTWLGKVFSLNVFYKTNFYTGSAGVGVAKIGGSSTTWKLTSTYANVPTWIQLPETSQYGPCIIDNNSEPCLIELDTDGQVFFKQYQGATFSTSTYVNFYGNVMWTIGGNM